MTEAVAPNTAPVNETTTTTTEPIEVVGGNSMVTFDELESAHTSQKAMDKSAEVKTKKETISDSNNEQPKKEAAPAAEKQVDVENKDIATEKQSAKIYKVKVGEKDVSLPMDTTFKVSVNGETIEVPLQDMMSDYSGRTEIQRRFTDFDLKQKEFQATESTVNGFIDNINQHLHGDKDPQELLNYLVETSGGDPQEYMNRLVESLSPVVEEYNSLSAEEREQMTLRQQTESQQRKIERLEAQQAADKSVKEVEQSVQELMKKNDIGQQEVFNLYNELLETGVDAADIDVEALDDYHTTSQIAEYFMGKIMEINPAYENPDELSMKLVSEMMENTSLTIEDAEDIIKDIVADKTEQEVSEKVREEKQTMTKPMNASSDPTNFDDFNDLYS